ncbi:uncharacterized protein AAES06_003142 [Glossophaga mutica]
MYQPGTARCKPGPRASASGPSRRLMFSVLFLLLSPPVVLGSHHPSEGEVLVVREERWRLCGTVALNPKNRQWSCCRNTYPFHPPTQRCCQAFDPEVFFIIPKDSKKEEADDCKTYTRGGLGQPSSPRKHWMRCDSGIGGGTLKTNWMPQV